VKAGLILDRDGTLIDFHRDADEGLIVSAFHPSQIVFLPGVIEALIDAQTVGFSLSMATNQPGAAKGQFGVEAIHRTNDAVVSMLAREGVVLDAIEVCLHHPEGGPRADLSLVARCSCRKPLPGMLTTLIDRIDLDRTSSWMIGDTSSDIEAGQAAGVSTALLFAPGRCEFCPMRDGTHSGRSPTIVKPSLGDIVREIISRNERGEGSRRVIS
jgi:D-glycero-D-manno-heptose 1,7-bisphosphate phosphatase